MARTITDKLKAIKSCKADIMSEVNSICGEEIINDSTIFEKYADTIATIADIKDELRTVINEKLQGEITDNTIFADYPKAIENYEPQPKYDMCRVTIDNVTGASVFMEPEDGMVTKGSLVKVRYALDTNYIFNKWEPSPTISNGNTAYFTINSDTSIKCQCTYVAPEPVKLFYTVYAINTSGIDESDVRDMLQGVDITSDEYSDFVTIFEDVKLNEAFDGAKTFDGSSLIILTPETTKLAHIIDNADDEQLMVDWCDPNNPRVTKLLYQHTVKGEPFNVYVYIGEGPITTFGSTPLRITITNN